MCIILFQSPAHSLPHPLQASPNTHRVHCLSQLALNACRIFCYLLSDCVVNCLPLLQPWVKCIVLVVSSLTGYLFNTVSSLVQNGCRSCITGCWELVKNVLDGKLPPTLTDPLMVPLDVPVLLNSPPVIFLIGRNSLLKGNSLRVVYVWDVY
jgi:hypothetical protein